MNWSWVICIMLVLIAWSVGEIQIELREIKDMLIKMEKCIKFSGR